MPAGNEMFIISGNRHKRRVLGETIFASELASRVKRAAGRRIKNTRYFTFKPMRRDLRRYAYFGNGGHKRNRIGMKRIIIKLAYGRLLNNFTHIHYGHNIAGKLNDGEVVCDEQIRQRKLLLKVLEKVEYLRLNGDIEGADRLITDYEFGLEDECSCDADALSLAA
jgi:hypothetical protein